MNDENLKSGYALWAEMRGLKLSIAGRLEMIQELLSDEYIDDEGCLMKREPLITREQALELLKEL